MATHYTRGRDTERRLMAELAEQGYSVMRTAASKGDFDVIAVSPDRVLLVSCKRAKDWKTAQRTHKKERARLGALAIPRTPKLKKVLAVWSDTLGPEASGRGGMWYCQEEVE